MADRVGVTFRNQRSFSNAPEHIPTHDLTDGVLHRDNISSMKPFTACFQWMKFIQRPDMEQQYSVAKGPHVDSDVYIAGNADERGYKFGVQLRTFDDPQDDVMKYRHVLCHVIDGFPAKKMKIKEGDELLVLNDKFVPILTHAEVLEEFKTVQADSQTTLTMDVRQLRKGKWKWLETRARLTAERKIDDVHYEKLKWNRKTIGKSAHHYKVPGSQLYCAISGGRVFADVMAGDDSDNNKTIWKSTFYWQGRGGRINFTVALSDVTNTRYIAVDERNRVIVKNETNADWFAYSKISSNTHFELNDMYLAYDHSTDKICVQPLRYAFDEIPAITHTTRVNEI